MAEGGRSSSGGQSGTVKPLHETVNDFQEGSEDTGGASLMEFCAQLDDCTPTIPDAVTLHYLQKAGFNTRDPRIVRLVSLAAQKFVSDIVNDSLQYCKMRGSGQSSRKSGRSDRRFVLTMEDLTPALADCGINVKKPSFYT